MANLGRIQERFEQNSNEMTKKAILTIPIDSNEAHLPTPRYGQYLTHAHNHITRAVAFSLSLTKIYPLTEILPSMHRNEIN